ncbi:urease accessory protein UreE [Anianabacter salinae]|uniref:urease accessory protein UreE n=1 Tax=Anianabacter salinae TaxID=2851023 RepID=UPI00225DFA37|nr:urease accessory protein UreE [Anianabacter salinae]MBV0911489.1 urease accessory protein UreE [Anianabacter salinae]
MDPSQGTTETAPLIAHAVRRAGDWSGAAGAVSLSYEARLLRRKRLTLADGRDMLVDLPEVVSLNEGDAFDCHSALIAVQAADEPLIEVRGGNLPRLAWHIGNRHTPCEIRAGHLVIRADHVLADMLRHLGADLRDTVGPFTPEGGAYGHGRTFGHDHGHNAGHDHDHDHAPEGSHDHGH